MSRCSVASTGINCCGYMTVDPPGIRGSVSGIRTCGAAARVRVVWLACGCSLVSLIVFALKNILLVHHYSQLARGCRPRLWQDYLQHPILIDGFCLVSVDFGREEYVALEAAVTDFHLRVHTVRTSRHGLSLAAD